MKMRSVSLAVLAVALALPGLGGAGKGEIEKNKALAQRVFDDILNRDKYELFSEMYAKDFVKHVDRRDYTLEQKIMAAKSMRIALPDLVMTVDLMSAEGDKVAILYTGRGTNDGPYNRMPGTGRKLVISPGDSQTARLLPPAQRSRTRPLLAESSPKYSTRASSKWRMKSMPRTSSTMAGHETSA